MSKDKFPMQPIINYEGTLRFKKNSIVEFLLDAGPFDMNKIALLPGITNEERAQFAQLIGYSLSGFGELSYVSDDLYSKVEKERKKFFKNKKGNTK